MTPVWHEGPLATLDRGGSAPVVWHLPDDGATARQRSAQALIAHLAGVAADTVRLARSAAGAPRVAHPAGWHLGLSRRGDACLIAAATRPVAVDRECRDGEAPLWDMLSGREAEALRLLDPADHSDAWLRRWTMKEAHAKLIGEPRRLAPETIETVIVDAVHGGATCEGRSRCWTRTRGDGIETVAIWAAAA
jgi:4'-phosphopantetheinyl transferase